MLLHWIFASWHLKAFVCCTVGQIKTRPCEYFPLLHSLQFKNQTLNQNCNLFAVCAYGCKENKLKPVFTKLQPRLSSCPFSFVWIWADRDEWNSTDLGNLSQISTNLINMVFEMMRYYMSNHASQKCPIHTHPAVCLLDFTPIRWLQIAPTSAKESLLKSARLSNLSSLTWKWPLTVIVQTLGTTA